MQPFFAAIRRIVRKPLPKRIFFISLSLVLLGGVFWGGVLVGERHPASIDRVAGVTNKETSLRAGTAGADFSLFWDVWARLQDTFFEKDKLDAQKMVYGAINGLVNSLGDPYTVFFPPQESKQFKDDISGSFGGIGAEIGIKRGVLTIISPLKDSPAERAGLLPQDQILKINATSTSDLTLDEAVNFIRGPKGTPVKLLVYRNAFEVPKEFSVVRDTIKVPTSEYKSKGSGIYYIALYNFNEVSGNEFRKALQGFFNSGDAKLIIDLRNNPGGFLNSAVDIASFFTPAGTVIVREKYFDGREDVYRSAGYNLLKNVPVVILVNSGSASASEILAGALRDDIGATLIGEKTFGKGSVQEFMNLPDNASLKVTIAHWFTPNGTAINGVGIEPDIPVDIPQKPQEGKDYYLDKAIEILKNK